MAAVGEFHRRCCAGVGRGGCGSDMLFERVGGCCELCFRCGGLVRLPAVFVVLRGCDEGRREPSLAVQLCSLHNVGRVVPDDEPDVACLLWKNAGNIVVERGHQIVFHTDVRKKIKMLNRHHILPVIATKNSRRPAQGLLCSSSSSSNQVSSKQYSYNPGRPHEPKRLHSPSQHPTHLLPRR